MGLRRIIGSALAALLLVTAALPALCGECRARKAEQACAGNHEGSDAAQHERHANAAVMSAACESCAKHRDAAPAELSAGTKAHEFSFMKAAHFLCGGVDRQVAAIGAESVTLQSDDTRSVGREIHAITVHFDSLIRGRIFATETVTANSSYEPLSVSLKI